MRLTAAVIGLLASFVGGSPRDAGEVLREALRGAFAPAGGASSLGNISEGCLAGGDLYLRHLENGTDWALRMYDASAKVPAGLLTASGDLMGDYDQCLAAAAAPGGLAGQYCTATLTFPVEDVAEMASRAGQYRVGLCVPSSCSSADVEQHLRHLLESRDLQVVAEVHPARCHTLRSSSSPYLPGDYAFLATLALFAALIIVGTGYDIYLTRNNPEDMKGDAPEWRTAVLAFSLKKNAPPLFNTDSPEGNLACINGIRVLSIAWVVVFHQYASIYHTPRTNAHHTAQFKENWYMMVFMNASLSTDSFFLIGGVLLAYIFTRDRKKNHPFNIFTFYLHRYIRVTPAYAAVIFFYATLMYHVGSGPLWDEFIKNERRKCVDWWFNNLLYVNNFNSNENTCIVQSWYLATDMQFYWLSPLLLYPMWRWPRLGWTMLVGGLLASNAALMAVVASYSGFNFSSWYEDNWNLTYTPFYTRAAPYLLGLGLGYVLQVMPKDYSMSKLTVVFGWTTCLLLLAAALFGGYRLRQDAYLHDVVEVTVYEGLHRTLWSVAVAWIIVACVKGHGGPVNSILSSKIMLPLGKLSYCVYLCHFAVIYVRLGLARAPVHIGLDDLIMDGIALLAVSFAVSVPITLAFEVPFLVIDKNIIVKRIATVSTKMRAQSLPGFRGTFSLQNHGSSSVTSIGDGMNFSSVSSLCNGMGSSCTVSTVGSSPTTCRWTLSSSPATLC